MMPETSHAGLAKAAVQLYWFGPREQDHPQDRPSVQGAYAAGRRGLCLKASTTRVNNATMTTAGKLGMGPTHLAPAPNRKAPKMSNSARKRPSAIALPQFGIGSGIALIRALILPSPSQEAHKHMCDGSSDKAHETRLVIVLDLH